MVFIKTPAFRSKLSFKIQKTGSLKCQESLVPFHDQAKLRTAHMQFHPVTAFHLKSHIVGCGGGGVVVFSVMVAADVGALGDHCYGNSQFRSMVIPIPLTQTFQKCYDEHQKEHAEHQEKHNFKQAKAESHS